MSTNHDLSGLILRRISTIMSTSGLFYPYFSLFRPRGAASKIEGGYVGIRKATYPLIHGSVDLLILFFSFYIFFKTFLYIFLVVDTLFLLIISVSFRY